MIKNLIFIILTSAFALSQNYLDALRPFWGYQDLNPTSMSIGSATVASGYMVSGLNSNPANYGVKKLTSMQMHYSNREFNSSSSYISKSNIDGFNMILPMRTYKGSLAVSAGLNNYADFLLADNRNNASISEDGGLTSYHAGASVEFAEGLFIGADIKFINGEDKMYELYQDSTHLYRPKYNGTSFTFGMLHRYSQIFQYGISIDLPYSLDVSDKYTYSNQIDPDESFSDTWYYTVKKPVNFHMGGALFFKTINLFYEFEFVDWTNLKFSSSSIYNGDIPASIGINNEIRENLRSTTSHHFGFAFHVPKFPIHLYAGYQHLPTPFQGQYGNNARQSYSFGFSFMVHQNFSLQGGYNKYSWEYNGQPENYEKFTFGVALHTFNF